MTRDEGAVAGHLSRAARSRDAIRAKVDDVNRLLARLDARDDVTVLDIGDVEE